MAFEGMLNADPLAKANGKPEPHERFFPSIRLCFDPLAGGSKHNRRSKENPPGGWWLLSIIAGNRASNFLKKPFASISLPPFG